MTPSERLPVVRVVPADIRFDVKEGETVFHAAQRNGISWPTICNGTVDCGQCYMSVVEGAQNIHAMGDAERKTLTSVRWSEGAGLDERLACCATLDGDIVVRRRSVRHAVTNPKQ
jgi:ferredoxin